MDNLRLELNELKSELDELRGLLITPTVAKFEKVSLEQFTKDYGECDEQQLEEIYNNVLILPVRSSDGSAGHDFVLTRDINLSPGEEIKLCTGIRVEMSEGWGLFLMPRSGLGSKFRLQLNNTLGLVDQDYYYSDNEGHIMATLTNDSKDPEKVLSLKKGDRFIQGVFLQYGIADNDNPLGKRNGGHGSSGL